jgi:hypothetical protein
MEPNKKNISVKYAADSLPSIIFCIGYEMTACFASPTAADLPNNEMSS